MVASMDLDSGRMIFTSVVASFAPSTSAASRSASGMELKNERMRIMLYVLIAPGMIRHHMVLSMFRSRMSR